MSYEVIDTTNDINPIMTTKKTIMAIKAAKRIKDEWAEQGFEYTVDEPMFNYKKEVSHWCVLLTNRFENGQSTINICYNLYSNPSNPNYNISAYTHIKGYGTKIFHWDEHLLNLLNEQINCIDDAVCVLEHPDEMLA